MKQIKVIKEEIDSLIREVTGSGAGTIPRSTEIERYNVPLRELLERYF